MMKQSIIKAVGAACTVLLASQAIAFGGKHREIDWDDKLELTDAQEKRIDKIESNYESQFRELRKRNTSRSENRTKIHELMQAMRAEIQQVLTPEQREQAQSLMREQHTKMQKKHVKELSRKLDLSDEQKSVLLKGVKEQKDNYQWPLDQSQREETRQQFEQLVQGVLTAEQQEKWISMKEKQMRKWHHPDGHRSNRKDKDCV